MQVQLHHWHLVAECCLTWRLAAWVMGKELLLHPRRVEAMTKTHMAQHVPKPCVRLKGCVGPFREREREGRG